MCTFFILCHSFITEDMALGERKMERDPEQTPFSPISSEQNDTNGPSWRVCLLLVFIVLALGGKHQSWFHWPFSPLSREATGYSNTRSVFCKEFLHVTTLFYTLLLLILWLLLFVFSLLFF